MMQALKRSRLARTTKSVSVVMGTMMFLTSCGDDMEIPKGFEVVASEGPIHFVFMETEHVGSMIAQREAGKNICYQAKTIDYCEVYFWIDRQHVLTSMPMMRQEGVARGKYTLKDGKIRLVAVK